MKGERFMKKNIITISREFGSGGRTIGKKLAEKLGVPYYDREIIIKVAEESGLDQKFIEEMGEYAPSKNIFSYAFVGRSIDGLSTNDYIWNLQCNIIRELADKGPCVIVGRCADYILRNRDDVLNVFIHADKEYRAERIVREYGERTKSPIERVEEKDKKRSINYQYYTDRKWGIVQNYEVSLDSGVIGIDNCVEIIASIVK